MRLAIAALLVVGLALPAAAESRKILVMQTEGRADAKLRAKVDAALLRLAKSTGDQVSASDITFADAAAAAGCRAEDPPCKDEVLGMLAVDELVITTATPKPGGLEVAVKRVSKTGASRDAMSLVATDKLDTLDAIAPLFGKVAPTPAPRPPVTAPQPKPAVTAPPVGPAPPPTGTPAGPQLPPPSLASSTSTTNPTEPITQLPDPMAAPEPPPSVVTTPPAGSVGSLGAIDQRDEPAPNRRLQKIGMIAGGTLFVAGLVFWASALGVQSEIDDAPTGTKQQLLDLQDLEAKGDGYAAVGNVLVLGGAILGGVSTYYFIKKGRTQRSSVGTTARLQPIALERGAGLALSFGGL